MTAKIKYFESKVNNTTDYGTQVNIEIGITMDAQDIQNYILAVTKEGCTIKRMSGAKE